MPERNPPYWIESPAQIKALASGVRQDIVDSMSALGPCSVGDLAHELGLPADALYYHIRTLLKVGLIVVHSTRSTDRRDETVYALAGRNLHIRYAPEDPENVAQVTELMQSLLRLTGRDFADGFSPEQAVVTGEARNLWGSRVTAWLTEEELKQANGLLQQLSALFDQPRQPGPRKRYALTWVLAPLETKPTRRSAE